MPRLPFSRSFLLFVILLHLACTSRTAQAENATILITHRNQVWRVSAGGTAERLPFEFHGPGGGSGLRGHGTTGPLPSPNNRLVALTRKNELWLFDVATGKSTQITHVGKPYDERYASVFVYITDWSPDNQRILYNVSSGLLDCVDCTDRDDWEVRSADYGFYIYDLETNSSHSIMLPGQYEAWLPDGDLLLTSQDVKSIKKQLLRFTPEEGTIRPVTDLRGWYGQIDVSADGRWLLTWLGQKPADKLTSQILKIDLLTGTSTSVTPVGKWAEYQWPQFSPSSSHVAYAHQPKTQVSAPPETLTIIDGRDLYSCPQRLTAHHYWIDDRTVVVRCRGDLIILDVETGEEKGRHKLE